jgi:hypothetical protein
MQWDRDAAGRMTIPLLLSGHCLCISHQAHDNGAVAALADTAVASIEMAGIV